MRERPMISTIFLISSRAHQPTKRFQPRWAQVSLSRRAIRKKIRRIRTKPFYNSSRVKLRHEEAGFAGHKMARRHSRRSPLLAVSRGNFPRNVASSSPAKGGVRRELATGIRSPPCRFAWRKGSIERVTATLGDATRNPVQIAPKRNVAAQESFDRSRAHESPTSSCLWALRLLTAILRDKSVPQAMNVGARRSDNR